MSFTTPELLTPAGFTGRGSATGFAAEWSFETTDGTDTIASTPGYLVGAAAIGMRQSDRILIRNTTNSRLSEAVLTSIDANGNGTVGGSFRTLDVGQLSPTEAAWLNLANGTQGGPVQFISGVPPISASGTFGAGGSVRLEGSDDALTWTALSIPALTAAGTFAPIVGTDAGYIYYRPNVTAGDGTTNISVTY
jgi:hypothetical protein